MIKNYTNPAGVCFTYNSEKLKIVLSCPYFLGYGLSYTERIDYFNAVNYLKTAKTRADTFKIITEDLERIVSRRQNELKIADETLKVFKRVVENE